jgi:hypothetical protein
LWSDERVVFIQRAWVLSCQPCVGGVCRRIVSALSVSLDVVSDRVDRFTTK